jgi:hypothetical protein
VPNFKGPMMRKILEGFDFNYRGYTFNQDDFAAMAAALKVDTLDEEHRTALQRYKNRYLALATSWEAASRPDCVQKHLKAVHTQVKRLMETLHALHDPKAPNKSARQSALALLHSTAPDNDWTDKYEDNMFAFTERLAELGMAANKVLGQIQGNKGGRPGDLPLKELVTELSGLFADITGKQPSITSDNHAEDLGEEFKGKFLDFAEAFLSPLPLENKNRRTLGLALKRILRDLKSI